MNARVQQIIKITLTTKNLIKNIKSIQRYSKQYNKK